MTKKFLTLFLSLFVLASNIAISTELAIDDAFSKEDKIYVYHQDIIISDSGMFILVKGDDDTFLKVEVSQINYDQNGLFIQIENVNKANASYCRFGHRLCQICGGCPRYDCKTRQCSCR